MRLLVLSDIHVEFHRDMGRSLLASLPPADVLVLAGDISVGRSTPHVVPSTAEFLGMAADKYPNTVAVLGNHDYYKASPTQVHDDLLRMMQRHPNVHWLENGTVTIEGTRFVGTTLWFEESKFALQRRHYMTDFQAIQDFVPWVFRQGEEAKKFLQRTVTSKDIVVTHHLPTHQSVHPRYKGDHLNIFFVSDVEDVIRENQPYLWIHGHTHESMDYMIGPTRILCNPFGYARQGENQNFNDHLIVEVPHESGGVVP